MNKYHIKFHENVLELKGQYRWVLSCSWIARIPLNNNLFTQLGSHSLRNVFSVDEMDSLHRQRCALAKGFNTNAGSQACSITTSFPNQQWNAPLTGRSKGTALRLQQICPPIQLISHMRACWICCWFQICDNKHWAGAFRRRRHLEVQKKDFPPKAHVAVSVAPNISLRHSHAYEREQAV